MPKYPWRSYNPLRTHDFDEAVHMKGREPGHLYTCRTCGRRFKFDSSAHRTWAVGKGRNFSALSPAVSARWLAEACTGTPDHADEEDSKRLKSRVA